MKSTLAFIALLLCTLCAQAQHQQTPQPYTNLKTMQVVNVHPVPAAPDINGWVKDHAVLTVGCDKSIVKHRDQAGDTHAVYLDATTWDVFYIIFDPKKGYKREVIEKGQPPAKR